MKEPRERIDAETLAAHAGFVSGLAAALVADPGRAEDVAQETMLAALERPPRRAGNLRGWLASVTRNLARRQYRGESRRRVREEAVARAGDCPSEADAVARMEIHRRVVEAVLALPEAQRAAVVRRFFDGLRPVDIARIDDVPENTVRSRIRRGLQSIRARLTRESGGDRAAWAVPLAAWLARRPAPPIVAATTLVPGALAVTAKAKILVAAVLLLLAGAAAWRLAVAPSASPSPAPPGAAPAPAVAEEEGDAETSSADAAANAPAAGAVADAEADAAANASGRLRLLVRDSKGAPAADATATLVDAEGKPDGVYQVGPDGVVRLDLDGTHGVAVVDAGDDAPAYLPPERFAGENEAEVRLEPGLAIEGRVVDAKGRPVGGVGVWPVPEEPVAGLRNVSRHWRVRTRSDGGFRLARLPAGRYTIGVRVPGLARYPATPPVVAQAGDRNVIVPLAPPRGVVVRFLDAGTGEPIERQAKAVALDREGSPLFGMEGPGPEFRVRSEVPSGFDVRGQARGYLPSEPVHVEIPEGESGAAVVFRLRPDPAYDAKSVLVALHVVDDLGRPIPSVYLGGDVETRGKYELEDGWVETRLPPGKHGFSVGGVAEGEERTVPCLIEWVEIEAPAGARVEREVVLQRGAFVRLVFGDDRPLDYVFRDEDGTEHWGTSEIQEEGRVWLVSRLPPGRLVLVLTWSDGRTKEIPVTLKAGEVTEVKQL